MIDQIVRITYMQQNIEMASEKVETAQIFFCKGIDLDFAIFDDVNAEEVSIPLRDITNFEVLQGDHPEASAFHEQQYKAIATMEAESLSTQVAKRIHTFLSDYPMISEDWVIDRIRTSLEDKRSN